MLRLFSVKFVYQYTDGKSNKIKLSGYGIDKPIRSIITH